MSKLPEYTLHYMKLLPDGALQMHSTIVPYGWDIKDIKEGVWLNRLDQPTRKVDALRFIPPSQIIQVMRRD